MVKVIGDTIKVQRIVTGLYSFDRSFINRKGSFGFPLGTVTELFGPTFCGKSTLTFGLSGILARETNNNIALADFEGFDPEFMITILEQSKFDGTINIIQKIDDEKTLDMLLDLIKSKTYSTGIIDSIGAISPIAEKEGNLGESNMGKRAKLVGQTVRKATHFMRYTDKSIICINHVVPNIGSMGTTTPGGEAIKYLAGVRIRMKRKEEFPDQSYAIEGKVIKNRFGYKDRVFFVVLLSGTGIHLGLSAMYDCFHLGLAERGSWVKIGDKNLGRLKTFFEEAHEGNNQVFDPFHELINELSTTSIDITEPDDSEGEVEDTET